MNGPDGLPKEGIEKNPGMLAGLAPAWAQGREIPP